MRHHFSLLLATSFFFLNNDVMASSSSTHDDDERPAAHSAVVPQVLPVAIKNQCYRIEKGQKIPMYDAVGKRIDNRPQETPLFVGMRQDTRPHPSFPPEEGKEYWFNIFTDLPHHVRVEMMEFLHTDPQGQFSLMNISQGFRRLIIQMPGRYNDAISTGNALKKQLFLSLLAGQSGDLPLFMRDQQENFGERTLLDLQQDYASRYYAATLEKEEKSTHGTAYRQAGRESVLESHQTALILSRRGLRLIPKFPEGALTELDLSSNSLRVAPTLSALTLLQRLDLSDNQLTHIDGLSGLRALNFLSLSGNQLTHIDGLSGLRALKMLMLFKNRLTRIEGVEALTELEYFYFYSNPITDVPNVSQLTKLVLLQVDSSLCSNSALLSALVRINQRKENGRRVILYGHYQNAEGPSLMRSIPYETLRPFFDVPPGQ